KTEGKAAADIAAHAADTDTDARAIIDHLLRSAYLIANQKVGGMCRAGGDPALLESRHQRVLDVAAAEHRELGVDVVGCCLEFVIREAAEVGIGVVVDFNTGGLCECCQA